MKHVKLFEQFINEGFKNKKDFEKFLEEIDGMGESQIRKIMGKDYIDTPGFYQDEKEDYDGIVDFMTSNMAKSEFEELKAYWEKHVAESINESKKFSDAFSVLDFFGGALPNDYNKAHAAASKAGYDLPRSLYDEAAMMAQDGENENLQEGRIALNHVYANAPVRNKVLEILRNGRVSEQDFMAAVSKAGAPTKWINRNSHFFKVEEEDGVKYYSLTKSGHVIMSALNESEVLEIYEEFGLEENLIVDPLDITKDFFYVSINGTVYGYQAKSGGNVEDLAKTFKGMLKYSAGKALAWLKKNAELVSGSKKALNEAKDTLTTKDKEWVKSLGSNKVVYSDQGGSGDHTLSAILSLMAGGGLQWGGAADFGFDHVDMYDESGKTVLPSATAGKYTFDQLLDKAKTIVKKAK
jgi:hypothetical protein